MCCPQLWRNAAEQKRRRLMLTTSCRAFSIFFPIFSIFACLKWLAAGKRYVFREQLEEYLTDCQTGGNEFHPGTFMWQLYDVAKNKTTLLLALLLLRSTLAMPQIMRQIRMSSVRAKRRLHQDLRAAGQGINFELSAFFTEFSLCFFSQCGGGGQGRPERDMCRHFKAHARTSPTLRTHIA